MDNSTIQGLREDYRRSSLTENEIKDKPFEQFKLWFENALEAKIPEPNAMVVASVSKEGMPSARVVLLKGFDERGFVFYTNYESQKGRELAHNPGCALVFNWLELERQIRIEGQAEKLSPEDSESYFHKRPKKSQIGAWASPQSQVIENREVLENNFSDLEARYADAEQLPRPEHWGGFRVVPSRIEFWQGRSGRLHDRLNFTRNPEGEWAMSRLAP